MFGCEWDALGRAHHATVISGLLARHVSTPPSPGHGSSLDEPHQLLSQHCIIDACGSEEFQGRRRAPTA